MYCSKMYRQVGAPLVVKMKPKSEITQQDVDSLHQAFCAAMTELFERTKSRHGCTADQKLIIVWVTCVSCQSDASKIKRPSHLLLDPWPLTLDPWPLTRDPWPLTSDPWPFTLDPWPLTLDKCIDYLTWGPLGLRCCLFFDRACLLRATHHPRPHYTCNWSLCRPYLHTCIPRQNISFIPNRTGLLH